MGYSCQFCQRVFSRSYNRDRHEKRVCSNRLEEKQENTVSEYSMDNNTPDVFDDVEAEEGDLGHKKDDEYDE